MNHSTPCKGVYMLTQRQRGVITPLVISLALGLGLSTVKPRREG